MVGLKTGPLKIGFDHLCPGHEIPAENIGKILCGCRCRKQDGKYNQYAFHGIMVLSAEQLGEVGGGIGGRSKQALKRRFHFADGEFL